MDFDDTLKEEVLHTLEVNNIELDDISINKLVNLLLDDDMDLWDLLIFRDFVYLEDIQKFL